MEYNDIYDKDRNLTGKTHLRGTPWEAGQYGLVVCVWVYDGNGHVLLTRRAKEKSFAGTWENSGGAAKAGEYSRQAIARELYEETGIQATEDEFELLESGRDGNAHYDYYCLKRDIPLSQIHLQPGETDEMVLARALQIMQTALKRRDEEIARLKPRAEYADHVLDSITCITTTQLAKELGMTAQELNRRLCEMRIQYWQSGQYMLYAEYARMGLAKSRTHTHTSSGGTVLTEVYLVWTERGRDFVHQLLNPKFAN